MTWGLAATVKAAPREILAFVAYHLEAGAHRIYLYLDAPCDAAMPHLEAHPKVRVVLCDATHWQRVNGGRPGKHQQRQTLNATHAYNRRVEVDWLIHMDVDEFLVSETAIDAVLATVQAPILRVRPMEQLAGDGTAFKAFIPPGPARDRTVRALYPTFGAHVQGGFLSHLAGKVFVRTGMEGVTVKIHNAFQNGDELQGIDNPDGFALAHCHASSWEAWRASYAFRHERGSYRAELAPNRPRDKGGLSKHELFAQLEADGLLRAFFDEVCVESDDLRARLTQFGLFRTVDLNLNATLDRHFPNAPG